MAIARVNTANGSASGSGTTVATGAQNHTAGNTIEVWITWEDTSTTVTQVTDTAGNTYSILTAPTPDGVRGTMAYATNITGHATNVVTATLGSAAPFKNIVAVQYSGLATSSVLDKQNTGTSGGGAGVQVSTGATGTTSQADEQLGVGVGCYGSVSCTPGANWTEVFDSGAVKFYERIVAATGSYLVDASTTSPDELQLSSSQNWVAVIGTFKADAGGGGGRTTKNTRAWPLGVEVGMNWRGTVQ